MACRIKNHLPSLISSEQTGFIQGRFIAENICAVMEVLQFTETDDIPGKLEWNYLNGALIYYVYFTRTLNVQLLTMVILQFFLRSKARFSVITLSLYFSS